MNAKAGTSESESLPVHVAACAERYKTLFNRLERIERLLSWLLFALLSSLVSIIVTLMYKGAPWQ